MIQQVVIQENTNPVIGVAKENGKQEIKVYDRKLGNMRYIEADKEKVDTFINNRNQKLKKQSIISATIGAIITAGLGIVGVIAGRKFNSNKLEGAFYGVSAGLMTAVLGGLVAHEKTDKTITQEFINENK